MKYFIFFCFLVVEAYGNDFNKRNLMNTNNYTNTNEPLNSEEVNDLIDLDEWNGFNFNSLPDSGTTIHLLNQILSFRDYSFLKNKESSSSFGPRKIEKWNKPIFALNQVQDHLPKIILTGKFTPTSLIYEYNYVKDTNKIYFNPSVLHPLSSHNKKLAQGVTAHSEILAIEVNLLGCIPYFSILDIHGNFYPEAKGILLKQASSYTDGERALIRIGFTIKYPIVDPNLIIVLAMNENSAYLKNSNQKCLYTLYKAKHIIGFQGKVQSMIHSIPWFL